MTQACDDRGEIDKHYFRVDFFQNQLLSICHQYCQDAKAKAWKDFKREYPFADLSKFEAQTDFIDKKHATAELYLKAGPGFWQSVSESDRKYWSDDMKSALGIG